MVVLCPPPSLYMNTKYVPDDESSYVVVEVAGDGSKRSSIREYVVIDVTEDEDEDDHPAGGGADLCPSRFEELPLRPMSPFRKAFIDMVFIVGTVAMEICFARVAIEDGRHGHWLISLLLMLPATVVCVLIASLLYLLTTRDFAALGKDDNAGPTTTS